MLESDDFVIKPESLSLEHFSHMWETVESQYDKKIQEMSRKHQKIRNELITKLETL